MRQPIFSTWSTLCGLLAFILFFSLAPGPKSHASQADKKASSSQQKSAHPKSATAEANKDIQQIKATEASSQKKNPEESGFDHQHSLFDQVLKNFVVVKGPVSQVNYKNLKKSSNGLDNYLNQLSSVSLSDYKQWSDPQKMAFLINAYNALTLKLIIDHYPVESIKKIGGFFSSPWKKEFFTLLGKKRHLDWIEHEVLRKDFNEPRIHFAVNCASVGCPQLRKESYQPDQLEAQLADQARRFLRDTQRNRIDEADKTLVLSKIFDWFEEDFEKHSGSVSAFVAPYITDDAQLQSSLKTEDWDIDSTSYDWSLNDIK